MLSSVIGPRSADHIISTLRSGLYIVRADGEGNINLFRVEDFGIQIFIQIAIRINNFDATFLCLFEARQQVC